MSYDIYYDKRFLKVGDKICPIVQVGSNNCFDIGARGQDIPSKDWCVMNYPRRDEVLFDPEELKEMFQSPEYKGDHHKSRYSYHEDFSKWLIAGIKNAMTIEEHKNLYNNIQIGAYIEKEGKLGYEQVWEYVNNDEEFLAFYDVMKTMGVHSLNVAFTSRDINKPKSNRKRRHVDYSDLEYYYVISTDTRYLYKLTKNGFYYVHTPDGKKFTTQKDAQKYLEKYWHRLKDFKVEKIKNKWYVKKEEI